MTGGFENITHIPGKTLKETKRALSSPLPKAAAILAPDPSPEPVIAEEVASAKRKVKARKKGRGQNILAGRMMQSRQILNTGQLKLGA